MEDYKMEKLTLETEKILNKRFDKDNIIALTQKLREAFKEWIDNGHNNFDDENTCILRIELTDGVLFSHGTRYNIDFLNNKNC